MKFINQLLESRATRNSSNIKKYTRYDCVERTYLLLLALEMMRHTRGFQKIVQQYASKTQSSNYNRFSQSQTDLYNFVYFVAGPDSAQANLADAEYAMAQKTAKPFPINKFNSYLQDLKHNRNPNLITRFFMDVEKSGEIVNNTYLDIRRTLNDWRTTSPTVRRTAATKLLFAFRAKLPDSDLILHLQDWNSAVDAELTNVKDTEPTDASAYIANYRFLVGSDNLMQTKRFLEMAKAGKSIPNDYVKAYLPIINMIDDLAQQGPGAIQHLLLLHKRLKK